MSTQHKRVMTYVIELLEELHDTTDGGNHGLWIYLGALLGRYRMRYLDRSQGPPVYRCSKKLKHVMTSLDGTMKPLLRLKLLRNFGTKFQTNGG
ncbi:hypothetical protein HanPSC8_Chr17g0780361 [Helianthus annuus]|nr:hypothetical protein HanPSC8_Chr17g0780361 [Helianthus annuus]